MKLELKTVIQNNHQEVFRRFNLDLFKALTPPLTRIEVARFDGCKKGDEVHLNVYLLGLIKQTWQNKITAEEHTAELSSFTDVGVLMPFPLKKWTHVHIVRNLSPSVSQVEDHITYSSGIRLLDYMMYPMMYLMFKSRSPVYIRELT